MRKLLISLTFIGLSLFGNFSCDTEPKKREFKNEILSEWQIERRGEYTIRNNNFKLCDKDGDGVLSDSEATEYVATTPFNYRFR